MYDHRIRDKVCVTRMTWTNNHNRIWRWGLSGTRRVTWIHLIIKVKSAKESDEDHFRAVVRAFCYYQNICRVIEYGNNNSNKKVYL